MYILGAGSKHLVFYYQAALSRSNLRKLNIIVSKDFYFHYLKNVNKIQYKILIHIATITKITTTTYLTR